MEVEARPKRRSPKVPTVISITLLILWAAVLVASQPGVAPGQLVAQLIKLGVILALASTIAGLCAVVLESGGYRVFAVGLAIFGIGAFLLSMVVGFFRVAGAFY